MSSLSRRIKVVEAEFLLFVRLEAAIEVTGVGANALMGETAANAKAKMAFIMVSVRDAACVGVWAGTGRSKASTQRVSKL